MYLSPFNLNLTINITNTILALRLSIGILIIFVITTYFSIDDPIWIYISMFVVSVEQQTLGACFIRASLRAIATLASVLYGLLIIILFQNSYLMNLLSFIFGVFVYSYLFLNTSKSYIAGLGMITLAISLINFNDFSHIFIRASNVIIGILIGFFLLYFFYPKLASTVILKQFKQCLELFSQMMHHLSNSDEKKKLTKNQSIPLEEQMITLITSIKQLIPQVEAEIGPHKKFIFLCNEILISLRRIFRFINSCEAILSFELEVLSTELQSNLIQLEQDFIQLSQYLDHTKPKIQLSEALEKIKIMDHKTTASIIYLVQLECHHLTQKILSITTTTTYLKHPMDESKGF